MTALPARGNSFLSSCSLAGGLAIQIGPPPGNQALKMVVKSLTAGLDLIEYQLSKSRALFFLSHCSLRFKESVETQERREPEWRHRWPGRALTSCLLLRARRVTSPSSVPAHTTLPRSTLFPPYYITYLLTIATAYVNHSLWGQELKSWRFGSVLCIEQHLEHRNAHKWVTDGGVYSRKEQNPQRTTQK